MNERIKNLFLMMINSPEKIECVNANTITFDNEISISYFNECKGKETVRDNKPLKLKSCDDSTFFWDLNVDIEDHLLFTIVTPYRTYKVPDFENRLEYANVLNVLDQSLAAFEEKKLQEYEKYFSC